MINQHVLCALLRLSCPRELLDPAKKLGDYVIFNCKP